MTFYTGIVTSLLATVYGFGEKMCGDTSKPAVSCTSGLLTASGVPFDVLVPSVAVFALPSRRIRTGSFLCIKHLKNNSQVWLPVTDKHYKKDRVDLSPAAVVAIGGKLSHYWSANVQYCGENTRKKESEISWLLMNVSRNFWLNGTLTLN